VSAAILTIGICALIAGDAYAKKTLTPHDVAKISEVYDAKISPDGQHIAYTCRVQRDPLNDENGPAWVELHVLSTDGVSRPFVTGEVTVSDVDWTPDGSAISFVAKRGDDENKSLYVIPVDGGEARRMVTHGASIDSYSWHPSGNRVAFLASDTIPESKEKLEDKGFNQQIYEEDKPFVRVWVHDMRDPEDESRALDLPGSASELHYSPDGSHFVLALAPTPLIDDRYMRRKINVVDAESGEITAKIDNPGKIGSIAWSPDGANIAFLSASQLHDHSAGRLMVVPAAGGDMQELVPDFQGHIRELAWRDPQTVTYIANQGVWTFIEDVSIDAAAPVTLFPTPEVGDINQPVAIGQSEPGVILNSISLARDGQTAAYVGESPRHPREVYFQKKGNPEPVRMTNSNPWLADFELAPQEPIRYTARDGREIEGILIRPLNEEPGTRYPLIVQVHGGPESHYRNEWMTWYSAPGQVAAARGFVVFYPNYRASTGRGVEFAMEGFGDPAGKEFDDYVDGIDYLVAEGLVDNDRVGITGGSYGGYASAWGATYYSDRFAASVMFVGLSDLVSKIGTTDIPNEMVEVHWDRKPWEDWQFFLERSPMYYADRCHTPTLILHGKDDPRVNPGQSRELYRHLKMRGHAPVRLVLYPGEQHGNRRAAARLDYSLRQLRWMEHYLKGPGGEPPEYEIEYEKP
jgi:dipeptidyl aminopeptidase/acylaminoacyl peptidase